MPYGRRLSLASCLARRSSPSVRATPPQAWTRRCSRSVAPRALAQSLARRRAQAHGPDARRRAMQPTSTVRRRDADVPVIFSRTPYNFNWWDVRTGAAPPWRRRSHAVKRGYAYVEMNERGHSSPRELRHPRRPGGDGETRSLALGRRRGRTAVRAHRLLVDGGVADGRRGARPEGLAAIVPQGFGAGVGRVGPYYEQELVRGGAVRCCSSPALREQNQVGRGSRRDDAGAARPGVAALLTSRRRCPGGMGDGAPHLPSIDILKAVDGPRGSTRLHARADGARSCGARPNDSPGNRGRLFPRHRINTRDSGSCPGTTCRWAEPWRRTTPCGGRRGPSRGPAVRGLAPTLHCAYKRATENTVVGERSVGDARLDYDASHTFGGSTTS